MCLLHALAFIHPLPLGVHFFFAALLVSFVGARIFLLGEGFDA